MRGRVRDQLIAPRSRTLPHASREYAGSTSLDQRDTPRQGWFSVVSSPKTRPACRAVVGCEGAKIRLVVGPHAGLCRERVAAFAEALEAAGFDGMSLSDLPVAPACCRPAFTGSRWRVAFVGGPIAGEPDERSPSRWQRSLGSQRTWRHRVGSTPQRTAGQQLPTPVVARYLGRFTSPSGTCGLCMSCEFLVCLVSARGLLH